MFYIVVFAAIAAFLGMRLYSVLGKRTGHEQPLTRAIEDRAPPVTLPRPIEMAPEPRDTGNRNIDTRAQAGLRAIIAAEPSFDVAQFLLGAQAAYRMILEAYWKGDEAALADLVDDEVLQAFATAIADRGTAGHVLDNRLVTIERAVIVDAAVESRVGRIVVRFDSDIAAITRDAEGVVIAGSLSDAVETHETWTFARPLKSGDPNWKLIDTDEG
ncbi:Tim44/TimA family putative adaptor protein [soil metagenome]